MVTPDAGEIANAAMPSGGRSEKQDLLQLHRLREALGAGCTQLGSPKATSGKLRSESQDGEPSPVLRRPRDLPWCHRLVPPPPTASGGGGKGTCLLVATWLLVSPLRGVHHSLSD